MRRFKTLVAILVVFIAGVLIGAHCFPRTETKVEYITITKYVEVEPIKTKEPYFYLSDEERSIVECMVMGESGGESYKGQILVAYCILNACERSDLRPSDVKRVYKYSGWNENVSESVKNAVESVFDDGHRPVDDKPIWFYAPKYAKSSFHESQRFIIEEGGHRFFGEKME